MATGKLTDKQSLFVKEYLVDLNATQAAIRSGYSEKTAQAIGAENLTKPVIAEALQKAMDERAKRVEVNQDYVLETILSTIARCQQSEPLKHPNGDDITTANNEGELVPAYKFEHNGVLKGCELLGKHLKMFTDKVEHSGVVGLAELTNDQIDKRLAALNESRSKD